MASSSELRVHGVSGTQPRDMLYTDPVPRDPLGPDERRYTEVHRPPAADPDFSPQAFHWGGLTAGSRLTAFWILLAPFAFANVAGWMSTDRKSRWNHAMVRAAGLGLTALFLIQVFTAIVLLPFLWVVGEGELQLLGWSIDVSSGVQRSVLLVLVLALSGLFLLLVLKASTQSHFAPLDTAAQLRLLASPTIEAMEPPPPTEELIPLERKEIPFEDPADAVITDPRLWRPDSMVHRLRRLHIAIGYGMIALDVGVWTDTPWASILSGALLAAIALITILTSFFPTSRLVLRATAVAPLVAVLVLIASLVTIFSSDVSSWQMTSPHTVTFITALVLGFFVLLSLAAGWISVGALVIATLIGGILGIAVGIVIESILGLESETPGIGILEANGAAWVAIAMLGLLWWLGVVAIYLSWRPTEHTAHKGSLGLVRRIVLQAPSLFRSAALYGLIAGGIATFIAWKEKAWEPRALTAPPPESPIYDIAIGMGVFLVVFVALRVWKHYGWKAAPLVLLGAALVVFAARQDFFAVEFFKVKIALKDNLVDIAVAVAIVVPGAFMLRSIWTGAGSGEAGRNKRRSVGILWDMGSFWPRWFHPLAPPAYGPVAVTELRKELETHPRDVLGAHSQGSLIGALALIYTADDRRPDRFVTYGSQLGNLYPKMYPDVGIDGSDGLVERVRGLYPGRWVNLYRDTDPIGGHYVESLGDQNRVVRTGTGHSRYELTPEYEAARKE